MQETTAKLNLNLSGLLREAQGRSAEWVGPTDCAVDSYRLHEGSSQYCTSWADACAKRQLFTLNEETNVHVVQWTTPIP